MWTPLRGSAAESPREFGGGGYLLAPVDVPRARMNRTEQIGGAGYALQCDLEGQVLLRPLADAGISHKIWPAR